MPVSHAFTDCATSSPCALGQAADAIAGSSRARQLAETFQGPSTIASLPGNSFLKYEPVHSGRSPFGLIAPDIPAVDWKVDESEDWPDGQWRSKT
jgi:hypothetical protein